MRLTEKEETEMFDNLTKYYFTKDHLKSINKLGQLEDIEEELGIDLITLFKALKNGIYFKVKDKIYFTNERLDLAFKEKALFEFNEYSDYEIYEFNEYGKTWALTRDELEK